MRSTAAPGEAGQAMAEMTLFSLLAVLLCFAMLALIPVHRTRTAATAAAYACAQFVSQAVDSASAIRQAESIGRQTIQTGWRGIEAAGIKLNAWRNGEPGSETGCKATFQNPILFNGLLGFASPGEGLISFSSRSEAWKGRWP